MLGFNYLLVLACVFQVISCQGPPGFPPGRGPAPGFEDIPEKCRRPPQGVENPELCCQMEPMFSEEDLARCGFKKRGQEDFQEKRGPPDCSKFICMMRQKNFVNDKDELDHGAVGAYMKALADGESSFEPVVAIANEVCLKDGKVPGPPQICEAMRLMYCIGGVMFGNCPEKNWLQTDSCKALKDHMDECKAPFQ